MFGHSAKPLIEERIMQAVILDNTAAQLQLQNLYRKLRMKEDSPQAAELRGLVHDAEAIARPKALCGIAYIDERGDDFVVIDGIRFSSRVLAVKLKDTHRVFPYLATCGTELEEWANGLDDMLHRYWSEAIREAYMRKAMDAATTYMQETYRPGEMSRMNPGSLADWPLEEQLPLFQLLGNTESTVGVQLTDSLLMVPTKTVSGIRFGAAGNFESCMMCPRPSCPNRRAPYDPAMYNSQYGQ